MTEEYAENAWKTVNYAQQLNVLNASEIKLFSKELSAWLNAQLDLLELETDAWSVEITIVNIAQLTYILVLPAINLNSFSMEIAILTVLIHISLIQQKRLALHVPKTAKSAKMLLFVMNVLSISSRKDVSV